MPPKIFPAARRAIKEIWTYTRANWGEDQADAYVRGLRDALERASANRMIWRKVKHPDFPGVFFIRYKRHYLFFRELSDESLGLISVLHENMDIPHRLRDDVEDSDTD